MAQPKESLFQKLPKLVVTIVAPLVLIAFSFAPLISVFNAPPQAASNTTAVTDRLKTERVGYQEVLKREPDNVTALSNLIDIQLQLKEFPAAIPPLTKLISLKPNEPSLPLLLGRLKQQTGDSKGALAQFQALYAKDPKDPTILEALVSAQLENGDTQSPKTLIQKRLKETPDDTTLLMQLALVYTRSNQSTEAIKIYDQLITKDPTDYNPILSKGITLALSAKDEAGKEESRALMQKAVTLVPPSQKPQVEQMVKMYSQLTSNNITIGTPKATSAPATPAASP